MRRSVKQAPPRASRPPRMARPTTEPVPRQADADAVEICTDNDLGAEWTGNIDCIENAREKPRRPPPRRHAAMKIGIVGSGKVGAACAFALVMRATAGEIVLVDRMRERAKAVAMDICYGTPSALVVDIHDGDYQDLVGAELVMITAGINEKAGSATDRNDYMGRLRLLEKNAEIYNEIVPRIVSAASEAVLLVITDPPDALANVARHLAQFSAAAPISTACALACTWPSGSASVQVRFTRRS